MPGVNELQKSRRNDRFVPAEAADAAWGACARRAQDAHRWSEQGRSDFDYISIMPVVDADDPARRSRSAKDCAPTHIFAGAV
jgi:hypothetical protein